MDHITEVILSPLDMHTIKDLGFVSQIVKRYIKLDGEHGSRAMSKI